MVDFDKINFTIKGWGEITPSGIKEFIEKQASDFIMNNPVNFLGCELVHNSGWGHIYLALPKIEENESSEEYSKRISNGNEVKIWEAYNDYLASKFNEDKQKAILLQDELAFCCYDIKGYKTFIESLKEVSTLCVAKAIISETLERYTKRKGTKFYVRAMQFKQLNSKVKC